MLVVNGGEGWYSGFEMQLLIQFLISRCSFSLFRNSFWRHTCKLIAGQGKRDQKPVLSEDEKWALHLKLNYLRSETAFSLLLHHNTPAISKCTLTPGCSLSANYLQSKWSLIMFYLTGYNWNQANIVHKAIHTLPALPVCFIAVQEAKGEGNGSAPPWLELKTTPSVWGGHENIPFLFFSCWNSCGASFDSIPGKLKCEKVPQSPPLWHGR